MQMRYTDAKINNFRNCVLIDAKNQRDEILCEAEEYENKQKEAAEKDIFAYIHNRLQQYRAKIKKETSEKIFAQSEKCRRSLIEKRSEIAEKVFDALCRRIDEVRDDVQYKNYLKKCIKEAIDAVGEGKITVFADKRDEAIAKEIAATFGTELEIADIFGGCRVINHDKGIICSDTLAEKLEQLKESFFEMADLSI